MGPGAGRGGGGESDAGPWLRPFSSLGPQFLYM